MGEIGPQPCPGQVWPQPSRRVTVPGVVTVPSAIGAAAAGAASFTSAMSPPAPTGL
jgi:hypothetical protein